MAGKLAGESLSVGQNSANNEVWPNLRRQFSDDQIFSTDVTGLFYKLMLDITLKFYSENCSGGKLSKDRITVMVAANLSVTEKKKIAYYWKISKTKMFYQC